MVQRYWEKIERERHWKRIYMYIRLEVCFFCFDLDSNRQSQTLCPNAFALTAIMLWMWCCWKRDKTISIVRARLSNMLPIKWSRIVVVVFNDITLPNNLFLFSVSFFISISWLSHSIYHHHAIWNWKLNAKYAECRLNGRGAYELNQSAVVVFHRPMNKKWMEILLWRVTKTDCKSCHRIFYW